MSRAAPIPDPQHQPRVDPESFRHACARFATGVAIATVRAKDDTPHGMTVSSFTSVSLQPPLILICVDFSCRVLMHFQLTPYFAVNILEESQKELSIRFATLPDGRFEGVDWYAGSTGAPLLHHALARFECRVTNMIEAGDHTILIGEVMRAESRAGKPLVYFDRNYRSVP